VVSLCEEISEWQKNVKTGDAAHDLAAIADPTLRYRETVWPGANKGRDARPGIEIAVQHQSGCYKFLLARL